MLRSSTRPYQRIADDIRARIERGDLRVGDRVPTTREIAKRSKVALATAAHALRALVDDGVVRSVPRVGMFVASPVRRRASPRADTRDGIVAAAIAIADDEGLAALSLRAVASKVGSPVMSLYRHVDSKDALVRFMTDAALGEEKLPTLPHVPWRARVEMGVRGEWRTFKRHPWLARVVHLSRPEPLPNAMRYADWMFHALEESGASPDVQMRMHVLLHAFVQGLAVNVEAEVEASGETGISGDEHVRERIAAFSAIATSGHYPAFGRVLGQLDHFDLDLDDLFERGLKALLDGFEAAL